MKIESGKTFVVTGGASGLGLETTRLLHGKGANVFIMDMNEELGTKIVEELGSDRAMFACVDITLEEPVKLALDKCVQKFKLIHGAVNCAGIATAMRVISKDGSLFPLDLFNRVLMVNLVGTFNVVRLVADIISKQKKEDHNDADGEKGVFILTASVAGTDGQQGQVAYSASKAGVIGMTLPMSREFSLLNIRVNTIMPGIFSTPMVEMLPQPAINAIIKGIPYPNRLGKGPEFAFLCQHLIENVYINGESIRLDGAVRLPKL